MPNETSSTTETGGANRFFAWVRSLGIRREPGWIGGVAAGVASRLGIDPLIVRGIIVVIAVLGGPALLLYAAAWLLLPDLDDRIHLERLFKGEFDGAVVGIGVIFLLSLLPFSQGFWFAGPWAWDGSWGFTLGRVIWTLAIIGSIVWLIVWLATRKNSPSTERIYTMSATTDGGPGTVPSGEDSAPTPPPAAPPTDPDELAAWKEQQAQWKREHAQWKERQDALHQGRMAEERRARVEQAAAQQARWNEENRRSAAHPVFSLIAIGVALIAGAVTALVLWEGAWSTTAALTGMAVTLGVLGLAVVINGFVGRRSGGPGALAVFVAIALFLSSVFGLDVGAVVFNNANWDVAQVDGDNQRRTVIAGNTSLDLSDYFEDARRDADGRVGLTVIAGNADLTVPADEYTEVRAHILAGKVDFEDQRRGGAIISTTQEFEPRDGSDSDRELIVDVWVIAGNIDVTQARN